MKEVGADRWYASRYMSSGVHADASTIGPDILALVSGVAAVGAQCREPLAAIRISVDVMLGAFHGFAEPEGYGRTLEDTTAGEIEYRRTLEDTRGTCRFGTVRH